MNREDVAMDVTFENLEILRKEVQAAKLLLSECDKVLEEDGGVYIELRAFLSSKMSADEVIKLLASQQGDLVPGHGEHLLPSWRSGQVQGRPHILDFCPPKHPEQAEGAQGEREVTPNPSCSMCSGNGYFCEFSTVETCWCCLPDPEPEETVEALKERIESLKAGVTHMKQQRDAAVARAALAQPSPAPELERPEVAVKVLISPDMKHIFVPSLPDDQQPRVADFMAHWMVHWVELAPAPAEFQCQIDDLSKRYANTLCELNRMRIERDAAQARVAELEERLERGTVYVEARRCSGCGHAGVNDGSDSLSACGHCEWTGPQPSKDECPDCLRQNCMSVACPECGGRYELVAEANVAAPVSQAGQVPEGWKLVPTDPTSQMTFIGQSLRYDAVNSIGEIYRQMIAAAPAQGDHDA